MPISDRIGGYSPPAKWEITMINKVKVKVMTLGDDGLGRSPVFPI